MIAMDVLRIQEKSKLARELMQRGIVSDFEEASRMIDERGMVKDSGFNSVERTHAEVQQKKAEAGYGVSQASSSAPVDVHFERIERSINELRDFVMRYAKTNDSNLRELDQKLKTLVQSAVQVPPKQNVADVEEMTVEEVNVSERPRPKQQTLQQEKPVVSKHPQSKLDPDNFSVDKYFNNAHGKMLQKK